MKISKKKATFRIQNNDRKIKTVGGYAVDIRQDLPETLKHLKFFVWKDEEGIWALTEKSTGGVVGHMGRSKQSAVTVGIERIRKTLLSKIMQGVKANQLTEVET